MIVIVDLDKSNIFGSGSSSTLSTKIRWLISSNHSAVSLYLEYAKEKVNDHKTLLKINSLTTNWKLLLAMEREQALNKIDDQLYQIFTKAEKQYRKLRTGEVDYSPELSELGLR